MYTIVMQDNKDLIATIKTKIYEKETGVDIIRFLIPQMYENIQLSNLSAILKYQLPNGTFKAEELQLEEEFYKNYLDYRIKVTSNLTSEYGTIILRISFIKTEEQVEVLHTGNIIVNIYQIENEYQFDDGNLEIIDQKILELNEIANKLEMEKADDIEIIDDDLWLTSNGEKIGTPIPSEEFAPIEWEEII